MRIQVGIVGAGPAGLMLSHHDLVGAGLRIPTVDVCRARAGLKPARSPLRGVPE